MYRGMLFRDDHVHTLFASARDIGNYSAGYIAGVPGQTFWGHVKYLMLWKVGKTRSSLQKLWFPNLPRELAL